MVAAGRAPCGLYQAVAAGVGDRLPPRIQEVFGVNERVIHTLAGQVSTKLRLKALKKE